MRRARVAMVKRVVHRMSLATVWVAELAAVVAMAAVAFGAAFVLTPNELWLALLSWGMAVAWIIVAIEPLWVVCWVTLTVAVRWLLSLGFDTDGDGKISFSELRMGTRKAAALQAARTKAALDKDGDGKLSAAEMAAGAGRAMSRTTRNLLGAVGSGVSSAGAAGRSRAGTKRNLRPHPSASS